MKEMPILPFRDRELQVGGSMLGLSCLIIISVSELHLQLHVPFRMNKMIAFENLDFSLKLVSFTRANLLESLQSVMK